MLLILLLCVPGATADPIVIAPTGDAEAEFLAVSGTGDAHSSCKTFGTIPCAAASGTGNASGAGTRAELLHGRACVSDTFGRPLCLVDGGASALGVFVVSTEGDAEGVIAVSPNGHASGAVAVGRASTAAVAVATTDARGVVAVGGGSARGYVAISAGGDAETEGCLTTPLDPCQRGFAVSG